MMRRMTVVITAEVDEDYLKEFLADTESIIDKVNETASVVDMTLAGVPEVVSLFKR